MGILCIILDAWGDYFLIDFLHAGRIEGLLFKEYFELHLEGQHKLVYDDHWYLTVIVSQTIVRLSSLLLQLAQLTFIQLLHFLVKLYVVIRDGDELVVANIFLVDSGLQLADVQR